MIVPVAKLFSTVPKFDPTSPPLNTTPFEFPVLLVTDAEEWQLMAVPAIVPMSPPTEKLVLPVIVPLTLSPRNVPSPSPARATVHFVATASVARLQAIRASRSAGSSERWPAQPSIATPPHL